MLDFPCVIDAEPIGQLDLVERILKQLQLVAVMPRPRQLMLVEDSEFHGPRLLVYFFSCDFAFSASLCAALSNAAMMFLKRASTKSLISGCVKM
jgi:hypothetical protein